eukprot:5751952-Alexandrium_andersonii.AAC.1
MLALQARIQGGRLRAARQCSGSLSMPASCRRSTWWATTTVRALSAFSASPPAKTGTSLGSSCIAGCGRRK